MKDARLVSFLDLKILIMRVYRKRPRIRRNGENRNDADKLKCNGDSQKERMRGMTIEKCQGLILGGRVREREAG